MKLRCRLCISLWTILLSAALCSCSLEQDKSITLASFVENDVDVFVYLDCSSRGNYVLSATFTPPAGYHLYSKDIPAMGINSLGRPTLIELTPNSLIESAGVLAESTRAGKPDFEPKELLVYPPGAVTLSFPIKLPPGDHWVEDKISITYMACSASQCKPPVEGKIISVQIPEAEVVDLK